MPYSPVTVIGFNANPPADDGTAVITNEVEWAKHIEKIGTPLKNAIESIDSNVEDVILDIEADVAVLQANLTAPSGTVMIFGGAAPSGWTTQNVYDDYGLRLVGTAGTPGAVSGDISWSSGLADRTIAVANLPDAALSFSLTVDSHSHDDGTLSVNSHSHGDGSLSTNSHSHSDSLTYSNKSLSVNSSKRTNNQGSQNVNYSLSSSTTSCGGSVSSASAGVSGSTGSNAPGVSGSTGSAAPSVSGSISLGGSGTAVNFDIQTYDVIMATKD